MAAFGRAVLGGALRRGGLEARSVASTAGAARSRELGIGRAGGKKAVCLLSRLGERTMTPAEAADLARASIAAERPPPPSYGATP